MILFILLLDWLNRSFLHRIASSVWRMASPFFVYDRVSIIVEVETSMVTYFLLHISTFSHNLKTSIEYFTHIKATLFSRFHLSWFHESISRLHLFIFFSIINQLYLAKFLFTKLHFSKLKRIALMKWRKSSFQVKMKVMTLLLPHLSVPLQCSPVDRYFSIVNVSDQLDSLLLV